MQRYIYFAHRKASCPYNPILFPSNFFLLYGICDLSSIQISSMRNIDPPCCDKKIEHLCDVIFRSCVSILIFNKHCHPIPNCCQLQTSYLVKTPTLFSRATFLNFALTLTLMLSLSVSPVISSLSP
jgi:hypothetical protein